MTEFLRSFAPNVDLVDFLELLEEEERRTRDNAVRKGAYGYEYWRGRREALAILRLRLEEAGALTTGELSGGRTAPR